MNYTFDQYIADYNESYAESVSDDAYISVINDRLAESEDASWADIQDLMA